MNATNTRLTYFIVEIYSDIYGEINNQYISLQYDAIYIQYINQNWSWNV